MLQLFRTVYRVPCYLPLPRPWPSETIRAKLLTLVSWAVRAANKFPYTRHHWLPYPLPPWTSPCPLTIDRHWNRKQENYDQTFYLQLKVQNFFYSHSPSLSLSLSLSFSPCMPHASATVLTKAKPTGDWVRSGRGWALLINVSDISGKGKVKMAAN